MILLRALIIVIRKEQKMHIFVLLFLWFFSGSLEAVPLHEELVDSIMKAARKNLTVEENVEALKHLVYEQDFTNLQEADVNRRVGTSVVDPEKSTLVSSLLHFFSVEGSGLGSETSEEDQRRDKFFKYLVGLYKEFPLIRIGYNNPREFDRSKGYVTLCFYIQKKYHHAALVFEHPGLFGGIDAALCHLTYGEESGSGTKREKVYRIRREGREEIINKLVWAKNNKSGDDESPDRSILRWYPYFTFEVDLKRMYKALSKAGWSALLERKHSYNYMGLISHNCCTYVAELLEEMGVNLEYRKSYKLFFTDEDLKRVVNRYAWNSKRKYDVTFTEYDRENEDDLPFAIANRKNLYRVLMVKSEREEERLRIEEEKARQKAEARKKAEEEKQKIEEERESKRQNFLLN